MYKKNRALKKKIQIIASFCFLLMTVHAQTKETSDPITLSFTNIPMSEAITKIETASNYTFFYDVNKTDLTQKVSLKANRLEIREALKLMLEKTNLTFEITNRQIALIRKPMQQPLKPAKPIQGTIIDNTGVPIIGANIFVKGTQNGTISDIDGNFTIQCSPEDLLEVTYVGFLKQEIAIGEKTQLNITLLEDHLNLDEVVVVGYGTQKKINLTGAVEQITAKDLANKSVPNLGQALQGLIPNLNVSIASGNPVANASYNIRGGTSFSGNDFLSGSPLIMVDGIPMDINNLNPDDIESISVIKDASAAAIYGARAAYGVILVTTKKGSAETAPKITYSGSYQIQSPTSDPGLLNSLNYQEAIMNAIILEGGTPTKDDEFKLEQVRNHFNNPKTVPNYYTVGKNVIWVANVNPWKELLRKTSPMKNHMISVSGGGSKNSYYMSLGYRDQDGIIAVNQDWKKTFNATLGVTSNINKWLTVDTKAQYTQYKSQIPHGQGYTESNIFEFMGMQGWRNLMTPRYTPSDSPVGVMPTHAAINGLWGNIKSKSETLMLKIGATVKLVDNLQFKTDFAYRSIKNSDKTYLPLIKRVEKTWDPFTEGYSTLKKSAASNEYIVFNAYFDYSKIFNEKHDISFVAGFNQEVYKNNDFWAQGLDMITDHVPVLKLTTGTKTFGDEESHWAIRGAFLRLNYIYENKYLFEMNGRYDGTSKFPSNTRFKFFPSFSVGWRISEESFMNPLKPTLSNLKLRASYGSLGNQEVNNYAYISTYGLIQQTAHIIGGNRPVGITPPGLVSLDLTWETATTLDFGADVTLFDRLSLNYDWYRRKTKDILSSAEKLPSVLGAPAPNQNSGEMETTGWELSTRWNDKLKNGFMYGVTLTVSDYQSKILNFSGNPQKLISSLYEGRKMGEIWGYETDGIFQTYQEIENAPIRKK